MRRIWSFSLVVGLLPHVALALPQDPSPAAAASLETGVRQVNDGDFEKGIFTLDAVIKRLTPEAGSNAWGLAQAYLYKGAAYVGLAQEEPAKASFREALKHNPNLRVSEKDFPPRVVRVFEAARKGKSKSVLYAGGGVGLAGIAAAVIAAATGTSIAAGVAVLNAPPVTVTDTVSRSLPAGNCTDTQTFRMSVAGFVQATVTQLSGASQAEVLICQGDGCKADQVLGVGQAVSAQLAAGDNALQVRCAASPFSYTIQVLHPQ